MFIYPHPLKNPYISQNFAQFETFIQMNFIKKNYNMYEMF